MRSPTNSLHAERCPCKRGIKPPLTKPFSPIRGLQFQQHDAWQIAQLAVASFNGTRPLDVTQLTALARYRDLQSLSTDSNARILMSDILEVFSELFFLGQLPYTRLQALWTTLPPNQYGCTYLSSEARKPDMIYLNNGRTSLLYSPMLRLRVLLHETAHAFLCRFSKDTQRGVLRELRCSSSLGVTGHGRAWQYLVKGVEERMGLYLGIRGSLGREDGLAHELLLGGIIPCRWDVQLLYKQISESSWFKGLVRVRDDSSVGKGTAVPRVGIYRNAFVLRGGETGRRASI